MEYNSEGVHALVCALEDLQNANLIFVDKKLPAVLKCLAYYAEFRTVLSYCNQGFDYQTEKKKAMGRIGDSNIFRLPKNPKLTVALVANMLVEFDAGSMDIVSFSSMYFPAPTKQESWEECFIRMIEPFKLALVSLVIDGVDDEPVQVERTVDFASSGLHQQTEYLLVAMANAVQEANFEVKEREEFTLMLEGFAAALDSRDSLMIKAIWLGLKKALTAQKLCLKEIQKVDEALKLYLIIK